MNTYAFPSGHDPKTGTAQFGMNLRDYFAAKVLCGMSSITGVDFGSVDDVANTCYKLADAMMKAREL